MNIMIDVTEKEQLLKLLSTTKVMNSRQRANQNFLKLKLSESITCERGQTPDKVISLGKMINIKTSFGYKYGLKLVLPADADMRVNKLSILSSLGVALFGAAEGSIISWFRDDEIESVEIIKVLKL